jgi:competence protein CoiA
VREGFFKKRHFYHLKGHRCSFGGGKTLEHLEIQKYICSEVPQIQMEVAFPIILRIADLYWPSLKLVFEIQCSPISKKELASRNRDYSRIGITVIWIFHERRFNRRFASPSERFARKKVAYYTNINSKGRGFIYDQANRRSFFKKPRKYPIKIDHPIFPLQPPPITFRDASSLYFTNDLVDRILRGHFRQPKKKKENLKKFVINLGRKYLEKILDSLS